MVSLSGGKPAQYGIYKSLKFVTPDKLLSSACQPCLSTCALNGHASIHILQAEVPGYTELFSVLHVFTPVVSHIAVTILKDVGT